MVSFNVWLLTSIVAFGIGLLAGRKLMKEECDDRVQHMMNVKLHEALDLPMDENLGDYSA